MPKNMLEDFWARAATDLGVDVDIPFVAELESGDVVRACLRVRGFGARLGMLVIRDGDPLNERAEEELMRSGFGFSIMSDPLPGEKYDSASYVRILKDWGWVGPEEDQPEWLGKRSSTG